MLEQIHLLRPWWLAALLGVAGVVWLARQANRSSSRWRDVIAPGLLEVLLERARGRGSRWPLAVAALLGTAVVALSGPTWERHSRPAELARDALVIVLDLSLSMYAQDLQPSRMERAKHKVSDVLNQRIEGVTALVVFAGDAHTVVPLTDDTRTILNLLAALEPDMMPVLGSRPGQGVGQALRLLANAGVEHGRILLVTDAVDHVEGVTRFADRDYPISILGVGTPEGAPIPLDFMDQPGRFLQNDQGVTIHAALDGNRLESIAAMTHGRYRALSVDDADIEALLATPLPQADVSVRSDRAFDVWHDAGYWLVVPLALAAAAAARRGVLVGLLVAALVPQPAWGDWWEDLWRTRDQQAYRALRDGLPEQARGLFDDPGWRSVAAYRSGDYEAAAGGFAAGPDADAHYNHGNALAHLGVLDAAIAAYDRALAIEPLHADAAHNRRLVAQYLQALETGAARNERHGGVSRSSRESTEDRLDGNTPSRPSSDDAAPSQLEGSEPVAQTDRRDANRDGEERGETIDSMEQWLRRVPDDPGGLLRRKFRHETNQRLRSGDYSNRQTDRIW